MKRTVLFAALLLAAAGAQAQTAVWRCGSAGNAYSDRPCDDGRQLDVADPRPAAAYQEAHEVRTREALGLRRLAAERRAREREAVGAAGFGARDDGAEAVRPKAKRAPPSPRTAIAGEGTSRATARASRRTPG